MNDIEILEKHLQKEKDEVQRLLAENKRLSKELELYKTRYLKMTEGMDWQEENEMWSDEE